MSPFKIHLFVTNHCPSREKLRYFLIHLEGSKDKISRGKIGFSKKRNRRGSKVPEENLLSSLVEWLIRFERETRFPRRTMASLSGNLGRFEFIFPAFLRPCNQEFHSIKKLHFPTLFFETVFAFVVGKQRFILARNFLPLGYFFETLTRWRKQPS